MPLRSLLLALLLLLLAHAHADTVRIAIADAPLDWNPNRGRGAAGSSLLDSLYERLVDLDSAGNPVPALATEWVWLEPNRWRIALRPGVRFHNGEPFDAPTAKKNLEAQRDDFRSASRTWLLGIVEIHVLDELTLELVTASPDAELPLTLAWGGRMAPSAYGFDGGVYSAAQLARPVGTGPYRLLEWQRGRPALLEANPSWWGGEVAVGRIEVLFVDDPEARLDALLEGVVALIDAPPERAAAVAGGLQVVTLPDQRLVYLLMDSYRESGGVAPEGSPGFESGEPNPLRDPRVRRALTLALDREALVAEVLQGWATPAALPVLPGSWAAPAPTHTVDHDPAAARALLAEAGYPEGFAVTVLVLAGTIPYAEAVMVHVREAWAAVGVEARLETPPFEEAARRYTQLDVSVGIASWGGLSSPRRAWMGMFGSDPATDTFGGQNIGRFIDAEINRLLGAIQLEPEDARRQALHHELLTRFQQVTPTVPLYRTAHVVALTDGFSIAASGFDRLPLRQLQPSAPNAERP